jgi:hypothetical protein
MTQSPQAGAPASNQFGTFQVHYPTDKQVRYIKSLVAQRVHPAGPEFAQMLQDLESSALNLKAATRMIDALLEMPSRPNTPKPAGASQKQFDFIKSLLASKQTTPEIDARVQTFREAAMAGTMTSSQASGLIDTLKVLPRKAEPEQAPLEAGMYRSGTTIYKVYCTVHGSRRMCAKELVLDEVAEGEAPTAHFEYRGLATRFVKADQRLSLEQAKEFGVIYGVCCKCGTTLTDENSIANGIGPVCGGKGW